MRYVKDIIIEDDIIKESPQKNTFFEVKKVNEPFETKKEEFFEPNETRFETYDNKKLNKIYQQYEIIETPIKSTKQKLNDLDKTIEQQKIYEPTEETLIYKQKKVQPKVEFKLKKKGKIFVATFCIVFALLGFLSIYNALEIQTLQTDITQINSEYRTADLNVKSLVDEVNRMTNEEGVTQNAEAAGYTTPTNSVQVELYERNIVQTYPPKSNFFDKIANFFKKLFLK